MSTSRSRPIFAPVLRALSLFGTVGLLSACAVFPSRTGEGEPPAPDIAEVEASTPKAPRNPPPLPSLKTATLPDPQVIEDMPPLAQLPPPRRGLPPVFFPDEHLMIQADLTSGEGERVAMALSAIEADPDAYPPYLFAALSEALHQQGEKEAAFFWFYASQLRTRYDANRCNLSPSAVEHERILTDLYGQEISREAFEQPEATARTLMRVMAFDGHIDNAYDPRWIYYLPLPPERGVKVPLPVPPNEALCQPEDRWPLIKDATRLAYEQEMGAMIPALIPGRTAALRSNVSDWGPPPVDLTPPGEDEVAEN